MTSQAIQLQNITPPTALPSPPAPSLSSLAVGNGTPFGAVSPAQTTPPIATTNTRTQARCWRIAQVCCQTAFATLGLALTYCALMVAWWTAEKDFRDDCRSQNATRGHISEACRKELGKDLHTPPVPLDFHTKRSAMYTATWHAHTNWSGNDVLLLPALPGYDISTRPSIPLIAVLLTIVCLLLPSVYLIIRSTSPKSYDRALEASSWVPSPLARLLLQQVKNSNDYQLPQIPSSWSTTSEGPSYITDENDSESAWQKVKTSTWNSHDDDELLQSQTKDFVRQLCDVLELIITKIGLQESHNFWHRSHMVHYRLMSPEHAAEVMFHPETRANQTFCTNYSAIRRNTSCLGRHQQHWHLQSIPSWQLPGFPHLLAPVTFGVERHSIRHNMALIHTISIEHIPLSTFQGLLLELRARWEERYSFQYYGTRDSCDCQRSLGSEELLDEQRARMLRTLFGQLPERLLVPDFVRFKESEEFRLPPPALGSPDPEYLDRSRSPDLEVPARPLVSFWPEELSSNVIEGSGEFESNSRTSSLYVRTASMTSIVARNPIDVAAMLGRPPRSVLDLASPIATPEKRRRFQSFRQVRFSWRKIFSRNPAS